jgi:hypothetical protein
MAKKQTDVTSFLDEIAKMNDEKAEATKPAYVERDTFKVEHDVLYEGLVEGYTPGIEGNYTVEGQERTKDPTDRRSTMWLTGYTQEHLATAVTAAQNDGIEFPMSARWLLHKVESGNAGRTYNRLSIIIDGTVAEIPAVPADQFSDN